jgi:hypothetical protein
VKGYYAHGLASTWPSCLGRLGFGWQPTVKTGAAAADRIPGEGRRGTVGQRRLGHEGGATD